MSPKAPSARLELSFFAFEIVSAARHSNELFDELRLEHFFPRLTATPISTSIIHTSIIDGSTYYPRYG